MARDFRKDDTVNIWGLELPMQPVLRTADRLWKDNGHKLVVTSARDGIHSAGSLHYYGLAVDIRNSVAWGYTEEMRLKLFVELSAELAKIDHAYQCIMHNIHLHVEFDES